MPRRPANALPAHNPPHQTGHEGEEPDDAFDLRPSKTQMKAHAHALQQLGLELAEMPATRLALLDMPEGLRQAIADYRRTKSHEGRRRQLQYLGKQMRAADEAPLREAVAAYKLGSATDTLALHEAEAWRAELVAQDEALTRWAQHYPASDLQRLRSLVRAARKDAAVAPEQRNGRGFRELFQFVRPWLKGEGSADDAAPQTEPYNPNDIPD